MCYSRNERRQREVRNTLRYSGVMQAEYRLWSSVRVEQLEAELSRQLSELRTETEETGLHTNYSSVPLPKDVSFFRAQREEALRAGLQVSSSVPLQSQAEVLEEELESCLNSEYTTQSLAPLLLQFFVNRAYDLAQIKYVVMLRWRRFCRYSEVIEKLYPHYKEQMTVLHSEHEDAVQRARRLAAHRETALSCPGNSADLLTPDDLRIYLRWLISHLRSVRTVHNFTGVLHYIPLCEEAKPPFTQVNSKPQSVNVSEKVDLPLVSVRLQDFLPELQSLIHSFRLSYDANKIKTTADELELFSMVWREFKTKFLKQEELRTFVQYGGSEARDTLWGRKSSTALKKEANWIHFIQVKPRRDPWQQKLITKLKESKRVDELLKVHDRFLQVSDVLHVASALKDQAAQVKELKSSLNRSETKHLNFSEIWTSIYHSTFRDTTQDSKKCSVQSRDTRGQDKRGLSSQTSSATSGNITFLSLNEDLDEETSPPAVTGGAYLSLTYLRHLKLRELQRLCLGLLNYLRSVERTLTFDLAGLKTADGVLVRSSEEESGLMNAARGGKGQTGPGLDSQLHCYNSPVDYKIHCSEFMEFAEVDNLHDFYSSEEGLVHTQDHRGLYVMYDTALNDLKELRHELLLLGSHFIQRNRGRTNRRSPETDTSSWAGTEVDRAAVLLQLWTLETEYLENKVQLLNCYFEAYQHTAGTEQRFAVAQVITDLIHTRPHFDLNQEYFTEVYREEISCLQSHQQLITGVLDTQIDKQREYLQRIWRQDHRGPSSGHLFGLPPNYTPKHLVSLSGTSPGLKSVFLTEVHPSLCLAAQVYNTLSQVHSELCQLHRASSAKDKLNLKQKLLRDALQQWDVLSAPGASYSPQIQKDLFSDLFFEDPILVERVGLTLVQSAEEKDLIQGKEKQRFSVETFCKLLELVTVRHRLVASASETAHLAQLYRDTASELGFGEFHLYLRPVRFEVADQTLRVEQKPVFITDILEDDSSVDRFVPSHLPLSIQELDENQIGRFSFSSQEAVIHLMNRQGTENLQVTLAAQITQKNALFTALKLLCFCHWAQSLTPTEIDQKCEKELKATADDDSSLSKSKQRLKESFVSIQLEKVGLRDEMLNLFMKKKQAVGGQIKTQEEAAKIKRGLIIDFLKKFNAQIGQYCVRAQIMGHYYSLSCILDDFPSILDSHFKTGHGSGSGVMNPGAESCIGTSFHSQVQLMSSDGQTLLNLWHIPDFTEVLSIFKTLDGLTSSTALHHMLQIASGLHDIISYSVSFSRLGNTEDTVKGPKRPGSQTAADWGGIEGIDSELQDVRQQLARLSDPQSPEQVGRLLQLRRQVLLLQLDTAVRHLIRESFLSSGDISSYQTVSDNMAAALPLLSDCVHQDLFTVSLPVPLDTQSQTFPWRSFIVRHGLLPLRVWDAPPIEYYMQLCLSGLSSRCRLQANAAMLGVTLLLEDVLMRGGAAVPLCLHDNRDREKKLCEEEEKPGSDPAGLGDPIRVQSVLSGFLLLNKQLQVFKESWARRRLGIETFTSKSVYKQFLKLYRAEIFHPSMRALAQHLGREREYEVLGHQSLLPPAGASEVEVKTWQLHKLLESTECDMIRSLQKKLSRDTTLVVSERTRQDSRLPTELWRKTRFQYSVSPERPQIVETFIQHLMEGAEDTDGQVLFAQAHLNRCLTELGCSLMERERRSFQLYSQFYEQILQRTTQRLHRREQDIKDLTDSQKSSTHKEVADSCRELMLENTALNARVAFLEQEKSNLEKQLSLKFKEQYDALVRRLLSTCVQLQVALDEQRRQMEWDVTAIVSRVRSEAVDKMTQTRKKYGCNKICDEVLRNEQSQREDIEELRQENGRLVALLHKRTALSGWRQAVDHGKLHRRLLQTQQREISGRCEALRVKMESEEEVILLKQERDVLQEELATCQDECNKTKKILSRKIEELNWSQQQSAQEARSRQQLDQYRTQTLDQIRGEVQDRDRQLRTLSEELNRGSRMHQLERQRSAKEIRQVKGQLLQERSLKHEAFQRVEKLQTRVSDMEAALSRHTSAAGQSRTSFCLSLSKLSLRNPSAGFHRASQTSPMLQPFQSPTHFSSFHKTETQPRRQTAADRHLRHSASGSARVYTAL